MTLLVLIVAEAALWYWQADAWAKIVAALIWIGFLMHNNLTLVLHELAELNDQLAGRKDEFRTLLSQRMPDESFPQGRTYKGERIPEL